MGFERFWLNLRSQSYLLLRCVLMLSDQMTLGGCKTPLLSNSSKTVPWLCRPRPPSSFCGRSPTAGDFEVVRGLRRRHPPAESDAHVSSASVPANSIGEAGRALVLAWSLGGWRLLWLLLCGYPSVVVLAGRWCCC